MKRLGYFIVAAFIGFHLVLAGAHCMGFEWAGNTMTFEGQLIAALLILGVMLFYAAGSVFMIIFFLKLAFTKEKK